MNAYKKLASLLCSIVGAIGLGTFGVCASTETVPTAQTGDIFALGIVIAVIVIAAILIGITLYLKKKKK